MSDYTYSITRDDEGDVAICVIVNEGGQILQATQDHPNYGAIVEALVKDTPVDDVIVLFDAAFAVGQKFEKVSDRVTRSGGTILFDLVPIDNSLTTVILDFMKQGHDFMPLVRFMEKLQTNPNPHSIEHLYRWLTTHNFTIHADGDFIAYKGLQADETSCHAGPAIVDGVYMNGHVPNKVGSVIAMSRDKVTFDPSQGCSVGLHAGTFEFARGFSPAGVVVTLKINPRDVVSVPVDSGDAKLRVCQYEVIDRTEVVQPTALYNEPGYWADTDDEDIEEDERDEDYDALTDDEIVEELRQPGRLARLLDKILQKD